MQLRRVLLVAIPALLFCGCANHPTTTPPPAPPPIASSAAPVQVPSGIMAGQVNVVVPPLYPPEAKAAGLGGTVVLKAIIGRDGTIHDLKVITGPQMFRDAAMNAVRQWKYKPYLLNGVPADVDTTITVNFIPNKKKQP